MHQRILLPTPIVLIVIFVVENHNFTTTKGGSMLNRIHERKERKIPHDLRSITLYRGIAKIDLEENKDSFGFKSGGDGDNGETLMYLLDCYFEDEDIRHL